MSLFALRPFIFTNLPRELRIKIYRAVYAGAEFGVSLTHRGARAAIRCYRPPRNTSFLQVSSQIYEEALPELASMCTLWLELRDLEADNGYDFIDLFTSIFTPALLKQCLPFIQTVSSIPKDLDTTLITGFSRFTALTKLDLRAWCLQDDELGVSPSELDQSFFASSDWEIEILENVRSLMDQDFGPLASIVREASGKFEVNECMILHIVQEIDEDPDMETNLVHYRVLARIVIEVEMCSMRIFKRSLKILARHGEKLEESDQYWLNFDTAEALVECIQALETAVDEDSVDEEGSVEQMYSLRYEKSD